MTQALPLAGVRIISVEQYGAGPFGTMCLADQGAEVIKIENPTGGGDMSRDVGPFFFGPREQRDSLFFHSFNRNKYSMTLDVSCDEGRAVLLDLVRGADALTSNLRGDVPEKLGLTYESLKDSNPAIVCAHLSAYGRDGPRADWPGFDYLMQGEAGYFELTGEPDSPPTRCGLSIVDLMTGLGLAYATLAALTQARATGKGSDIDVSLFDMALHNLNYLGTWYLNKQHNQERVARSGHPSLVPCQLVQSADGWVYVMCNKAKFWPALCECLQKPEWIDDPRYATPAARMENRKALSDDLDATMQTRTTNEWLEIFAGKVPASPIYDVEGALTNPYVTENGKLQTIPYEDGEGDFQMIAPPVRSPGTQPPTRPGPALGAHTESLLKDLGYDEDRINSLRDNGVI